MTLNTTLLATYSCVESRTFSSGDLNRQEGKLGDSLCKFLFTRPLLDILPFHLFQPVTNGEMHTDLVLVWSEDNQSPIDEARLRSCWPQCQSLQRLGPIL